MWGTFWRTLGRRISLIFMVADLLLPAYRLRIETQNPHTAFSSAMGGRDVENTGYAVRPALRYGPSRPKNMDVTKPRSSVGVATAYPKVFSSTGSFDLGAIYHE